VLGQVILTGVSVVPALAYAHAILRTICIAIITMYGCRHNCFSSCTVTWKLVCYDLPARASLPFHQFPKKSRCCWLVLSFLNQDIENISVLIYGAPQVPPLTANRHDVNFIYEPRITKCVSVYLDLSSICRAKFDTPAANSFIGNNNSTLRQKVLNIA